ncbi:MAG: 3-oxoacyl-[acyl-carrier-protein] reductase [Pseudobutyrivibrio sp.]|nr:3-oxoacyl-[acyl-carrier-protein] reductase [Pseudobutyrivibrio sp.]
MSLALVTGGSRGIGSVIAINLAKSGYDVAICYSGNEKAAEETVEKIKEAGVKAMALKADVSDPDQVSKMFSDIKEEMGNVDVLVNNAGITRDGLLISMSEESFDAVIDINLKGTFNCTKLAVKDMMRAKHGRIINISSIVGINGNAGQANYAASKAGLIGFTKSVAREYGSKGITVNAVAPGFIETVMTESLPEKVKEAYLGQIPVKRFGSAEDVAAAVEFLASDKASYITGQVLEVTGGM